jgi:hypothetical protein
LPWEKCKKLLDYAIKERSEQHILTVTAKKSIDELKIDTSENRELLGAKANKKDWYKRTDHGEYLGKIWFESLDSLEGKRLKRQYEDLNQWIEQ